MLRATIQGDALVTHADTLPFVPGASSTTPRKVVDLVGTQAPLSNVIGKIISLVSPAAVWSMSDVSKFRSPSPSCRHLGRLYQ
jgi:hypothetical protein